MGNGGFQLVHPKLPFLSCLMIGPSAMTDDDDDGGASGGQKVMMMLMLMLISSDHPTQPQQKQQQQQTLQNNVRIANNCFLMMIKDATVLDAT